MEMFGAFRPVDKRAAVEEDRLPAHVYRRAVMASGRVDRGADFAAELGQKCAVIIES